jgi:hypothetical protein
MTSQNTLSWLYILRKELGFSLHALVAGATTDKERSKHHQSMMTIKFGFSCI